MLSRSKTWIALPLCAAAVLAGCADECTGSIETTVLYAAPGPHGVGRALYVEVRNKPGLGVRKTLFWQGKEFGTFAHVVIIHDPENRLAARRTICFTKYRPQVPPADGDLNEQDIPRIVLQEER